MKYNPYPRLLTRLFFGSVFLILGLISLLSYRNVTTKSLRDKGETLPSKVTNTGDYAIQITDVSGPEAELKGKDYSTFFYTVTYKDESGKESKIGLHADDSDFYDLIDDLRNTQDLKENPKWLIANVNNSSNIKNYSEMMASKLSDDEKSAQLDYYITLEDTDSIRYRGQIVFFLFFFLGMPFFLKGVKSYLFSQKELKEFYNLYPELHGSLEQIQILGDQNEADIRIFLYKNHLVSYHSTFKISNLEDAKKIYHSKFTTSFLFIPIIRKNQLCIVHTNGKEDKLPMKRASASKTELALTQVDHYISEKFPNIEL